MHPLLVADSVGAAYAAHVTSTKQGESTTQVIETIVNASDCELYYAFRSATLL